MSLTSSLDDCASLADCLLLCAVQSRSLLNRSVTLTRCVCGYQPGAGAVLARPPERRPVQEAQPLPGRHQPGEGQYAAAASSQRQNRD